MSSKSIPTDEWATPAWLFEPLRREFGLELDVCASHENYKLPNYLTEEDDALEAEWYETCIENDLAPRVWCNPPYSRALMGPFMQKCVLEWKKGCLVVALVKTDHTTAWWKQCVAQAQIIRLLEKRVRFVGAPAVAPFGNSVVIFNPGQRSISPTVVSWWPQDPKTK